MVATMINPITNSVSFRYNATLVSDLVRISALIARNMQAPIKIRRFVSILSLLY